MKKYFTSLNLVFAVEILAVILVALGIAPREVILVWTGLAIFYIIFSPLEDSLWLLVASIPLFAALPFNDNFETLSNWRILIAVLFLVLFFKKGLLKTWIKSFKNKRPLKELFRQYLMEFLAALFIFISILSIFVANHKFLAVKKLLFLINIFLLFFIIRNLAKTREAILKIWQAAIVGSIVVLTVALSQFLAVWFIPLIDFWRVWADKVISAFYGQGLAHLLSYSNTWFAYYGVAPPTLRLFSIFPDSHSLAMYLILSVPIFLAMAVFYQVRSRQKIFFWILTGLSFFGIIFSGSRGAWLSVASVIFLAFYFSWRKTTPELVKKTMLSALIFLLLFIASNAYPLVFYKIQSWQSGQDTSSSYNLFERARSISDADELSNKGRLEIWRASLNSIIKRPILGVGVGNYITVLNENTAAAKKGASAHNLYLDFTAEIGIVGGFVLIAIFIEILYACWLVFRRAKESYFSAFGFFFGLYFLWVITYSLFDVVLLNEKVLLLFMVGAATLYNLKKIYRPSCHSGLEPPACR